MTHLNGKANVGDVVAYEDQANPRETFRVVAGPTAHGSFTLVNDLGGHSWSDLRQHGWTLVRSAADMAAMESCNGCEIRPASPTSAAGYCTVCEAQGGETYAQPEIESLS